MDSSPIDFGKSGLDRNAPSGQGLFAGLPLVVILSEPAV